MVKIYNCLYKVIGILIYFIMYFWEWFYSNLDMLISYMLFEDKKVIYKYNKMIFLK